MSKINRPTLEISDDHAITPLMNTPEPWPTDPQQCHDLLNRFAQRLEDLELAFDNTLKLRDQQVEDLQAALDEAAKLHDQAVQEHQGLVDELRPQLDLCRGYVFGPRRERLVDAPGQGHLFELGEA